MILLRHGGWICQVSRTIRSLHLKGVKNKYRQEIHCLPLHSEKLKYKWPLILWCMAAYLCVINDFFFFFQCDSQNRILGKSWLDSQLNTLCFCFFHFFFSFGKTTKMFCVDSKYYIKLKWKSFPLHFSCTVKNDKTNLKCVLFMKVLNPKYAWLWKRLSGRPRAKNYILCIWGPSQGTGQISRVPHQLNSAVV